MEEGLKTWERRKKIKPLVKDNYLLQVKHEPRLQKRMDNLRSWVDAVNSAEEECEEYMPKGQRNLPDRLQE